MANLYARYIKERLGDEYIETDHGFATYRFLDDGKTVYIVDIYVIPEFRNQRIASGIADRVVEIAKRRGAIELIGTVSPRANGATESMKALLGYGMALKSASSEVIVFGRAI